MVKILVLLLFSLKAFSSTGIEEQRKYNFQPRFEMDSKDFNFGGFIFHPHSNYVTYDIYFDTAAGDVKNNFHSFRLRRVEKKKGTYEYSIQLKSEMQRPGETRTELEYKNMKFQAVNGVPLTNIIDNFIENPDLRKESSRMLNSWISNKMRSSLAPFQKLRSLNVQLNQLNPIAYGTSLRQRYYVIADQHGPIANEIRLKKSRKNSYRVPSYFKENLSLIWLMEASFDKSTFFNLSDQGPREIKLVELELENKYRPRKVGTKLLSRIEEELKEKWGAKTGLASKYLQAMSYFANTK